MRSPANGLIEIPAHHPGDLDNGREQIGVVASDLVDLAALVDRLDNRAATQSVTAPGTVLTCWRSPVSGSTAR